MVNLLLLLLLVLLLVLLLFCVRYALRAGVYTCLLLLTFCTYLVKLFGRTSFFFVAQLYETAILACNVRGGAPASQ